MEVSELHHSPTTQMNSTKETRYTFFLS